MIRLAAFGALMFGAVAQADAGWIHDVRAATGTLPAASVLRYDAAPDIGASRFGDALQVVFDTNEATGLDLVVLHARVLEADLQQELFEHLRASSPHQLDAALASSGNHDNPVLLALLPPFRQAVLDSRAVAELREALATHGLRIGSVEVEKLTLDATSGTPRLRGFLWLTIQPA